MSGGDAGGRLKWRVAAQVDRIAHAVEGEEAADTAPEDGLVVQLVGQTDARLRRVVLHVGEVRRPGAVAEEEVIRSAGRFREAALGRVRPGSARDDHAVVAVAAW